MNESPKRYFLQRIGKPIPFSVLLSNPALGISKRNYEIIPRKIEGTYLLANVLSRDYNSKEMQIGMLPKKLGDVKFALASYPTPGDVVEAICRQMDPDAFRGKAAQQITVEGGIVSEVQQAVVFLKDPANRADEEITPHNESIIRLMQFIEANTNLVMPGVFSSKEGIIRARWQHGADKTLFVGFPASGPLPLTLSFPKQGNYGLVKVHSRCMDDADIPQYAATVGIRITKN